MDVKVINEQMAFNLKHCLINLNLRLTCMKWTPLPNLPKAVYFHLRYILTKLGDTRLPFLVTSYETIEGESSINFRTVFIALP